MDRDFKVHDDGVDPWEAELLHDEDLVIFLNRLAIASSQGQPAESPLAEFTVGSKRASVSAVGGRLFYSDLHRVNVQNINVIAEEVVGFLTDRITPGAHEMDPGHIGDDASRSARFHSHGNRSARIVRGAAILFMAAIVLLCAVRVFEAVNYRPRLVEPPDFVPGLTDMRAFFDLYGGCFLDVPEDAGQLIELGEDGRFRLYEIWRRRSGKGFVRVLVEDLSLQLGLSEGRDAALGGDIYLVVPRDENSVTLFGQEFTRYDKQADRLSLWPKREVE